MPAWNIYQVSSSKHSNVLNGFVLKKKKKVQTHVYVLRGPLNIGYIFSSGDLYLEGGNVIYISCSLFLNAYIYHFCNSKRLVKKERKQKSLEALYYWG